MGVAAFFVETVVVLTAEASLVTYHQLWCCLMQQFLLYFYDLVSRANDEELLTLRIDNTILESGNSKPFPFYLGATIIVSVIKPRTTNTIWADVCIALWPIIWANKDGATIYLPITSQTWWGKGIGTLVAFLFKVGKSILEWISNSKMGVTASGIVPMGTIAKIVEWEAIVNKSKSSSKWMMEWSRRATWSMAKPRQKPKEKMSFGVIMQDIKIKRKMC